MKREVVGGLCVNDDLSRKTSIEDHGGIRWCKK
jgi:hypothetical protein